MKHILLSFVVIVLSFLSMSCSGKNNLVGKWKMIDSSPEAFFEFTNDGHVIIMAKGDEPKYGTYATNENQTPYQIDVILNADDPNPSMRRKAAGIYKIEGNKLVLKLANRADAANIHPSDFNAEDRAYMTKEFERFEGTIPTEYTQKKSKVDIRVETPKQPNP